jgi:flagellar FliL protein
MAKAEKESKETSKAPQKTESVPEESKGAAPSKAKKGGGLKLIIIVVAAMVIGGAGAFAAMRFFIAPSTSSHVESSSEGDYDEGTQSASEGEDEEPIVAPTKAKAEESGGHGGGHSSGSSGGHGGGAEGAPAVEEGPLTVELKPFTTNLNEPSGRRFLKVTLGMEVDNQEAADELNKKMPDVQDSVLMLLSSQSSEDISGVDGKERLRSQILNRTNSLMVKNKVKKVKYLEFIVQ